MASLIERLRDSIIDVTTFGDSSKGESFSGGFATPAEVRFNMGTLPMEAPVKLPIPDKPSTSMLMAMAMPELADDARAQLAVEVEDVLGYTPLRKDTGAPSRLQRLLAELEIEGFDPATVTEYKERMRLHHQALVDQDEETPDLDLRSLGITNSTFMSAVDMRMFLGRFRTEVVWAAVPLAAYTKPVPEFVLRKAMQIKRAAPDATFFVDELRHEIRTLDPFLIVELGGERAAIEVWDEPEFEKTL